MRLFLLIAIALAGIARADTKADLDALQGQWTVTAMSVDGKPAPASELRSLLFTVSGEQYKLLDKEAEVESGTLKLGEADGLKTIDYAIASGSDKDKTQHGIYKLEGGTLTMAHFQPGAEGRPKKLEATKGQSLITLEKSTPPAPVASPSPVASATPPASPSPSPSAAPAGPPTLTGGKGYSPAGDFTITVPDGWKLAESPKEGSDIDVETDAGGDVWVEHTEREGVEPKAFLDTVIENLKKQASKLEEKSRTDVTIAGMKGQRAVVEATVGENDLVYVFTVIASDTTLYQITGLAVESTFADQQKHLDSIADSFKLGKP